MTQPYDLLLIGAGHNGLTTAATLAQAGKRVLKQLGNKFLKCLN